jgi:hypothetical protein
VLGRFGTFQWARFSRPATKGRVHQDQTRFRAVGAQCHSSCEEGEDREMTYRSVGDSGLLQRVSMPVMNRSIKGEVCWVSVIPVSFTIRRSQPVIPAW